MGEKEQWRWAWYKVVVGPSEATEFKKENDVVRCPFLKADSSRVENTLEGEETKGTEVN